MDNEFAIKRDAERYADDQGYLARAMERVAHHIETYASSLPEGYYRHWHMVDAAILRGHSEMIVRKERIDSAENVSL